jgi:hypothetical protein
VPPVVEGAGCVVSGAAVVDGADGAGVAEAPPDAAVPAGDREGRPVSPGAAEPPVVPHAAIVNKGSVNIAVTALRWRRRLRALGSSVFMAAS